jgi:hypothetical protein
MVATLAEVTARTAYRMTAAPVVIAETVAELADRAITRDRCQAVEAMVALLTARVTTRDRREAIPATETLEAASAATLTRW